MEEAEKECPVTRTGGKQGDVFERREYTWQAKQQLSGEQRAERAVFV